jgi:Glycosyl hydrolases family 15
MVQRAASYLARNGPVAQQDRWEENAGISPFTPTVEIVVLVCAAGFLKEPATRGRREATEGRHGSGIPGARATGSAPLRRSPHPGFGAWAGLAPLYV